MTRQQQPGGREGVRRVATTPLVGTARTSSEAKKTLTVAFAAVGMRMATPTTVEMGTRSRILRMWK